MARFFNITGPCASADHYMLGPEERIPDLLPYIEQKLYFVVHAARQTGKSTAMIAFAQRLRGLGYAAVYATLETSQERDVLEEAEAVWIESLQRSARIQLPTEQHPPGTIEGPVGERLGAMLARWSAALHPTPLVLLLDEVDVIRGVPLVNLLRQLRAGFIDRPQHFPASVGLVGMRDLRDYLTHAKDGAPVSPGSPFNIKSASLTMRNFTTEEVASLYAQHTSDTGQVFTAEASARAFWWTQGAAISGQRAGAYLRDGAGHRSLTAGGGGAHRRGQGAADPVSDDAHPQPVRAAQGAAGGAHRAGGAGGRHPPVDPLRSR